MRDEANKSSTLPVWCAYRPARLNKKSPERSGAGVRRESIPSDTHGIQFLSIGHDLVRVRSYSFQNNKVAASITTAGTMAEWMRMPRSAFTGLRSGQAAPEFFIFAGVLMNYIRLIQEKKV